MRFMPGPRATEKHVWVHRQKPALPDFASISVRNSYIKKTVIFSTNQYLKLVQPFDFGRLLGNPIEPFVPPIHSDTK
ncbi:hypothetical protein D9613_011463 [Agrocybe pediades]|uniref:Uncharacterized protein n=1 Tax=Agrocybe pediades TaxID=84607 RepID=A0A8H4QRZ9_9AGAR|nr:hypothetical protein D9613_011463 [Agrocybe pediades]